MDFARTPATGTSDRDLEISKSLEEAFLRQQPELLGTLYYLVGNRHDAQEALQEAFIKCWRNRESLPDIRNLQAWIYRIVVNTGRDFRGTYWRRKRKSLPEDEPMPATAQLDPADQLEQTEQLARLRQAVAGLRAEEQEVFLMRQNGGLRYEDIAAAIGISVNTVKTRMRSAISKLRVVLCVDADE